MPNNYSYPSTISLIPHPSFRIPFYPFQLKTLIPCPQTLIQIHNPWSITLDLRSLILNPFPIWCSWIPKCVQTPKYGSWIPDLQFPILNPLYSIPDPQSLILNPWSSIPDPQSLILNPWSSIPDHQYLIINPWSSIPDPQSLILNPWSSIPYIKSLILNPWSSIPDPQSIILKPLYSNPDHQSLVFIPWSSIPDPQSMFFNSWSSIPDPALLILDLWFEIADAWTRILNPQSLTPELQSSLSLLPDPNSQFLTINYWFPDPKYVTPSSSPNACSCNNRYPRSWPPIPDPNF